MISRRISRSRTRSYYTRFHSRTLRREIINLMWEPPALFREIHHHALATFDLFRPTNIYIYRYNVRRWAFTRVSMICNGARIRTVFKWEFPTVVVQRARDWKGKSIYRWHGARCHWGVFEWEELRWMERRWGCYSIVRFVGRFGFVIRNWRYIMVYLYRIVGILLQYFREYSIVE